MGNNASKPDGRTVIPPVAPVSPLSHSRREQKSGSATSRPSNPQQSLAPSQSQSQAQAQGQFNSHPQPYSQRHVPDDRTTSEISGQKHREKSSGSEQSTPVTVPDSRQQRQRGPDSQFEPSGPPRDPNYIQHSNLNFPPRLPLPIVEELHTPGSPIITSAGIESVLHDDDEILPRQNSGVSTTTLDDDELGDELRTYPLEDSRRTVPTLITWKQGGDKVYVTGTFTSWNKKFRMNRDPATNVLSTTLQLPPGTHHVKFIVDGEMQLSDELPTAVDFTNILVNYIEVSADDIPTEPIAEFQVPEGLFPPLVLPEINAKDHAPDSVGKGQTVEGEKPTEPVFWGEDVPRYLIDLDLGEHSRRYQRAARGVAEFPTPPSLPLFLGKSILNGTTPMKDDSSVLNMPNHTVLNHLATSSIRHQVLATSVTTRYKRKVRLFDPGMNSAADAGEYVTTIMCKPTVEDGD